MKITVVTLYDAPIAEYGKITEEINKIYCKKHGYEFVVYRDRLGKDGRAPQWDKVKAVNTILKRLMNPPDFVFWIDADACFMNHDIRLEDIALKYPKYDMLVATDMGNQSGEHDTASQRHKRLNTGTLLVRNTKWARNFTDWWWENTGEFKVKHFHEQSVLGDAFNAKQHELHKRMLVLSRNSINSQAGNAPKTNMVVHLMGTSTEDRVKFFSNVLADKSVDIVPKIYNSGKSISIVMLYDDPIKSYGSITEQINKIYSSKHGYELTVFRDRLATDGRAPQWDKVKALDIVLNREPKPNVAIWIDADAAFQNHTIKIEDVMDKFEGDILVADDKPNGHMNKDGVFTNTGVILVRNTEWSRKFVKWWWENTGEYKHKPLHEQKILNDAIRDDTLDAQRNVNVIPAHEINSVFQVMNDEHFIWHLMMAPSYERQRVFGQLLKDIEKSGANTSQPIYIPQYKSDYTLLIGVFALVMIYLYYEGHNLKNMNVKDTGEKLLMFLIGLIIAAFVLHHMEPYL